MSKLPSISARECISALQRGGFYIKRQKGSHIAMQKDNPFAIAIVPNHKMLKRGTLRGIIDQAGLTVDVFIALLKKD